MGPELCLGRNIAFSGKIGAENCKNLGGKLRYETHQVAYSGYTGTYDGETRSESLKLVLGCF